MRNLRLLLALFLYVCSSCAWSSGKTELTWLGHSAFKLTTPSGGVLLIDPWILGPHNKDAVKTFVGLNKVDYLLVSHGHHNHVGDAVALAKKTGAKLVAASKLRNSLIRNLKFPKKQTLENSRLDNWSSVELLDGEVKVTLVPAEHLASSEHEDDAKMRENAAYAGSYGFVIEVRNGPTIYHTGDTKLTDDFEQIGKKTKIDVMLVCIGDKFTMGPEDAAEAVEMVRPGIAIPMHFDSVAGMTGTPDQFAKELSKLGSKTRMVEIKVGEPQRF